MAKALPTQAWLWHRRLSHLSFDYINLLSKKDVVIGLPKLEYVKDQLCSSCELSKAKRSSFKSKAVPSSKGRLNLLHMELCGPMRVASVNRKKYILAKVVIKNKKDEDQTVIRNKARLVAKGYAQEERRIICSSCTLGSCSSFCRIFSTQVFSNLSDGRENGISQWPLKEEVNVAQLDGFVDPGHPEKVYRPRKALYRLKQAPRAWYDELSKFMTSKGFTKEAEYMALSASCAQVMWTRTQLQDYGLYYNKIPLYWDSQSATAISCNLVQHSHTKHIHTRYHFIKEQVENGIIELYFVRTKYQLSGMLTKALPEDRFKYLVRRIGMRCLTLAELEVLAKESA
nr:retrovirus-related Pol polyprotein from transposon TNT 1-94 [Tanacetum cinerariifolium]